MLIKKILKNKWLLFWVFSFAAGMVKANEIINMSDYGLRADGKTDDGPIIQKVFSQIKLLQHEVIVRFPENKIIYVASGLERYVFCLDSLHDVAIDGNGSTFMVDKELRFLKLTNCNNFKLYNCKVDMTPSPVAEAIVRREIAADSIEVKLDKPEQAGQLGGPTRKGGEQDFFGMLWWPGKNVTESSHYYVNNVTVIDKPKGIVHIQGNNTLSRKIAAQIKQGDVRISLPVPGIAHRHGPGAMFCIDRNNNIALTDIEVWAAPWFAFQISRNNGNIIFRQVNIRPKPNSGKITSSWRDGFHVKGNYGKLLFEDCILEGMNDDAFNVSTHAWEVTKVITPYRVQIKQVFPIQYMPVREGGKLLIITPDGSSKLKDTSIKKITQISKHEPSADYNKLPPVLEIELNDSVGELKPGCILWDLSSANPDTTIRGCLISSSCRFQSKVILERCRTSALLWFYCQDVEGPFPSGSIIRNNIIYKGRGNDRFAVCFTGWRIGKISQPEVPAAENFPMYNIIFENNKVHGGFQANRVKSLTVEKNVFFCKKSDIYIKCCPGIVFDNNDYK